MSDKPNQASSVDEMLRKLGTYAFAEELEEQKKAFNRLSEQMVFLTAASASMQIEFHEQKEAFQKVLDMLSPEVWRTTRVLE